jgi:ABC-2 type transporter
LERRCLSLGMEIMAKPRILFLECPTLDLDNTSALFIARSLRKFVDSQGITICSTLHHPRQDCLDLFDNLLLLGAAGRLVYNGPVSKIGKYFKKLNYYLHDGEGMTDWLLDISAGRLAPPVKRRKRSKRTTVVKPGSSGDSRTNSTGDSAFQMERQPSVKKVMFAIDGKVVPGGVEKERVACIATRPFDSSSEQAKATCDMLYEHLDEYLHSLPDEKRSQYEPPKPYSLPRNRQKDFLYQLGCQLSRSLIIAERNWFSGFLDTTIIVVTVVLVTVMDGVAVPTKGQDMRGLNYYNLAEPIAAEALLLEFPTLFSYATTGVKDNIAT